MPHYEDEDPDYQDEAFSAFRLFWSALLALGSLTVIVGIIGHWAGWW